jgi:ribosomal protein S18 acetylase RimI-like enzyme
VLAVRKLLPTDIDDVVARIAQRLSDDATIKTLVNPAFSFNLLHQALSSATSSTWIAVRDGQIVGHLYGALLQSPTYGRSIWIGPDGASYDDGDVLSSLYARAGQEWTDLEANEHYVWTLDDPSTTSSWFDLGFSKMHSRGVMELLERRRVLNEGYTLRYGTFEDLDLAIYLDDELERAQSEGPSFLYGLSKVSQRDEWIETLSDPETRHLIVEYGGQGVAQCVTFPSPPQRSSFDGTIHLSAVVVTGEHRRRGIATAMIDAALNDAGERGFDHVETNWRITNRQAVRYWTAYGFEATYVRLHRSIGPY